MKIKLSKPLAKRATFISFIPRLAQAALAMPLRHGFDLNIKAM